jgi:hypothetical protein
MVVSVDDRPVNRRFRPDGGLHRSTLTARTGDPRPCRRRRPGDVRIRCPSGFGPDGPGAAGKPGTIEDPATVIFERVGSTEIARRLTPAFGGRGVGTDLTVALMNLVAEGLQLLENGAFVRVSWSGGHPHYMATRRGRTALTAGRIDVLLRDYENT